MNSFGEHGVLGISFFRVDLQMPLSGSVSLSVEETLERCEDIADYLAALPGVQEVGLWLDEEAAAVEGAFAARGEVAAVQAVSLAFTLLDEAGFEVNSEDVSSALVCSREVGASLSR
jgi:hypothetical protein